MSNLLMHNNRNSITIQIGALKRANELMKEGWGTFTNEPAFMMADSAFMKKLLDKEYVCPFSPPFNGGAKPFLMDMYIAMNEEIIKELEGRLRKLDEDNIH